MARHAGLTLFYAGLIGLIGTLGCGDSQSTTATPTASVSVPVGTTLAVFTDQASGFQTSDVYDSDNELVRFESSQNALWWVPTNLLFDGWVVQGSFLDTGRLYQVRFGMVGGTPRAYFTESGRGTLCDLSVVNNVLQIAPTDLLPP